MICVTFMLTELKLPEHVICNLKAEDSNPCLPIFYFKKQGDVPKVGYFRNIPDEFKIKSLYSNDLILNIASKSKEAVQKLKFLDSPD